MYFLSTRLVEKLIADSFFFQQRPDVLDVSLLARVRIRVRSVTGQQFAVLSNFSVSVYLHLPFLPA